MKPAALPNDERLLDLLAARATEGLSPAEESQLAELARSWPDVYLDALDHAAAAADLALAGAGDEPLPVALRSRIAADATAHFARQRGRSRHLNLIKLGDRFGTADPNPRVTAE